MHEHDTDDQPSDSNFERLLQRSWSPPESRREFRDELLIKLRHKQLAVAARRRTVIRLFTAAASVAAAVGLIIFLNPDLLTATGQDEIISNPRILASVNPTIQTPDLHTIVEIVSEPDPAPVALDNASESPLMAPSVAADSGDSPNPEPGVRVFVHHGIEYRRPSSFGWHQVANRKSFRLVEGTEIRPLAALRKPVGLGFSKAAGLVLSPGSLLRYENNILFLRSGTVIVMVGPNENPVRLKIAEYKVSIKPESLFLFTVKADPKFTMKGTPAPTVMALKGSATTHSDQGQGTLTEGFAYTMDRYLTPQVPGRRFNSGEQHMAKRFNRVKWNPATAKANH